MAREPKATSQEPAERPAAEDAGATPVSVIETPRIVTLQTDADAHKYVMGMAEEEEALFWCVCLPSCSHWFVEIAGTAFARYQTRNEAEEDETEEVKSRVKGVVLPLRGSKAREVLAAVPKLWIRWVSDGKKKDKKTGKPLRAGYLQTESRKDFRRQPSDEHLALHIGFGLIPFAFDRSKWHNDRDVYFNRQDFPAHAFQMPDEKAPTVKLYK